MALLSFDALFREADAARARITVAVAGAADRTVLEALSDAHSRGWIEPRLCGPRVPTETLAAECRIDVSKWAIVDSEEPAVAAVAEVRAGRAQVLMKGQIDTPALMKAVLNAATGLRTGKTLCQVVAMEVRLPGAGAETRNFLLSDTGVTIAPTLEQKVDILESLILVARSLGCAEPRVALMAASEKVNPALPDTVDSATLARRNAAGEFTGAVVQGPLSFDLAFASDAGEKKRIAGGVVGAADAMLFPDLLSANLTVKAIMYTADCRFGGVVCGAACPIVFMSRADTTATRLNSLALASRVVAAAPHQ